MKILVVDDSTINNILLQNFLEDNNYQVLTALNVPDAFDILLKDSEIDLVLLDLMMPDFGGFDFLNHLKSKNIDVPVIVVTANAGENYKKKSLDLGAKEFITKPIQFNELLDKIKRTVEFV